MILTIKSVEDKGSYKLATDSKGVKYSVWGKVGNELNPAYSAVKPGVTADFEETTKEKDGKTYRNLVNVKNIQAAPTPQQQPRAEQGGYADAEIIKRASIEAQTAYNGIIALAVAGKCPPEALTMAMTWAKMRIGQPLDPDEVPF